jgi:hypothetical protein
MKKISAISLLFVLLIASAYAISVNIYPDEMAQGANEMKVVIMNHGPTINDASVSLNMPDLDIRSRTAVFDIKKDKPAGQYFEVDVDGNAAPDYYPVRITVADKKGVVKRTHTWVYVG